MILLKNAASTAVDSLTHHVKVDMIWLQAVKKHSYIKYVSLELRK